MKKLVIGFLVSVLCLGVVGCGSTEKKLYEKYKTLIDALEAEDYLTAVGEIYAMAQGNDNQKDEEQSEEEKKKAEMEAAMKEVSYGEWRPMPYDEEKGIESIVMNEDGTCTINGDSFNWLVKDSWENSIRFDINGEANMEYRVRVNKNTDMGYHYMYLERMTSDSSSETVASFYKLGEYTVVDITMDNWKDYFETTERIELSRNSFDEVTSFNVHHRYSLKDEYQDRIRTELSEVAIEYVYTYVRGMCTVDIENETYELGDITYTSKDRSTSTSTMGSYYIGDDKYSYGFGYSSFYVDEFPEDEVNYNVDFEMIRMKGQIFLLNK